MRNELPVTTRGQAGVSLIEVMVSMMLLAVALLGIAVAFPQSRTAVVSGNQVSTAVSLARQTLEAMRNRTYTNAVDEITNAQFPDQSYGTIANHPTFRRRITVADNVPVGACNPPPPTACMKTVTVTVFYRDDKGVERSTALSTIFVRPN